jgi:hypothetical protein
VSVRKFSSASISSAAIKSSKLWDQETFPGTYESISTAIVDSGGAASIEFTSIPSTYTHLQIRCLVQANSSGNSALALNYNSDTTAGNYYRRALLGDGSSASTQQAQQFYAGVITDNAWSINIIDILDYKNTNKYKTTRVLSGRENNSTGAVFFTSQLWMNTNAISTINISPAAANFIQYSSIALYGIRGA